MAKIGHKVRTLKRVSIGPLKIKDLPSGAHRELTYTELNALKKATSGKPLRRKKSVGPKKSKGIDEVHEEQEKRREAKRKKKKSSKKKPTKVRKETGSGARGAARPTKGWRTEKSGKRKKRR